jgi:hypothetical protein
MSASKTGGGGNEPQVSNGVNVFRLKDINPGAANSQSTDYVRVGKRLYFVANNPANGQEIYVWKP